MSSNPIRLKYLFKKYLDNTVSRQELEEFWQLMSELSENDFVLQELQEQWQKEEDTHPTSHDELDKVFNRVQQKIGKYETGYNRKVRTIGNRNSYIMVAASLLLCVALGWWLFTRTPIEKITPAALAKAVTVKVITLPDGTTVTLNKDSHLDYPATFSDSTREVTLTGEAFFDVKHDPGKPFMVHTGAFVTRVLGTAFNIRAYSKDSMLAVTVERGKVQVQRQNSKKALSILQAGDQLVIEKQTATPHLAKVDAKKIIQWKDSDLQFDDIRFEEAALLIGSRYNVELKFSNEALHNCRFTVDLSGKTLDDILDILGDLTRSTWYRENDTTILIKGEGCKNQ
ncbi:MAG: FecR domain-containing protein [Niastella sp.]|nr:FecR domain-containing protein [Niastella sp.]